MTTGDVTVETGCRLHFGLISLGKSPGRNFGGVGVMLDAPRLQLSVTASDCFRTVGEQAPRLETCAAAFLACHDISDWPQCVLELREALPPHAGLGSGTQTALAVAAGLRRWLAMPPGDAAALAADTGRAQRSAIGTHGFLQGGLMFDEGRLPEDAVGRLGGRVELPHAWHVVLAVPMAEPSGIHGQHEALAFEQLPPVTRAREEALRSLAQQELLPAAQSGDFEVFAESVYRYGHEAGLSFAELQGGPFASPAVAERIDWFRSHGITGCGQSSWGPGVFAWARSRPAAERLAQAVAEEPLFQSCTIRIAGVKNEGAKIEQR